MPTEARAFWIREPGRGEIRTVALPEPGPGEVLVRTLRSGVSRGTEGLVFRGGVPQSQYDVMRAPFQEGDFPGPVKYGYLNVGVVDRGPDELRGRTVFCLFPHQTAYVVPADAVTVVPDEVPPERAVLAGTVETAVNALWDAGPLVGDRITVVGAGMVGCCVARLVGGVPGTQVTLVDVDDTRAHTAASPRRRLRAARGRPRRSGPGVPRQRDVSRAAALPGPARRGRHGQSTSAGMATSRSSCPSVAPSTPDASASGPARSAMSRWPGADGVPRPSGARSHWTCSRIRPSTRCSPAHRRSTSCPT